MSSSWQVKEAKEGSMELRALISARSAGDVFDLRCEIRERLIEFLQKEYPTALPHARAETIRPDKGTADQRIRDEHPPRSAVR
jgi:hypothetical protein